MGESRPVLHPDLNPEWRAMIGRHNALIERRDVLNSRVTAIRIPMIRLWRLKSLMRDLQPALVELERDWIEWEKSASELRNRLQYSIVDSHDSRFILLQATAELRHQSERLRSDMLILGQNCNDIDDGVRHQQNLLLSWFAVALSVLGAVLAGVL